MTGESSSSVINLEAAQAALRDSFLGWQCRLRQLAMRQAEGRPTNGMRPEDTVGDDPKPLGQITVLVLKAEPEEITAQFRHMVQKTNDPAERPEINMSAPRRSRLSATARPIPREPPVTMATEPAKRAAPPCAPARLSSVIATRIPRASQEVARRSTACPSWPSSARERSAARSPTSPPRTTTTGRFG